MGKGEAGEADGKQPVVGGRDKHINLGYINLVDTIVPRTQTRVLCEEVILEDNIVFVYERTPLHLALVGYCMELETFYCDCVNF